MMKRFGWIPDKPDQRDYRYALRPAVKMLSTVDLRSGCSPVENQANLGSCTANMAAGLLEFLELLAKGKRSANKGTFTDLSRLFVYYNTRMIEGTANYDSGASIRNTIKAIVKQGACPEVQWPYKISQFKKKPTTACYKSALDYQALEYSRLNTVDEMRQCLAEGFPFGFGFSVYESFLSDKVAKTGMVSMPGKKETLEGGHAVVAAGYDDAKSRFLVRNSWGTDWGLLGYCRMPYDYLANRNLSDDFWTVRRIG